MAGAKRRPRAARKAIPLELLLTQVVEFVSQYVVCTDAQYVAIALWIVHTHAIEAAECTPYLAILSAEKRSGKSLLLEVLGLLVPRPLATANISDAALFRSIAADKPTLLFDEVDAIFGPRARDREDLRGLLNAGYRRGQFVYRMGGPQKTTLERFEVFCAKALAGIGRLPETVSDRSIILTLKRKGPSESAERFRRRDAEADAAGLQKRLSDWSEANLAKLRKARPRIPPALHDRAADGWEALLAIADAAAGEWPERARMSALSLSDRDLTGDESEGVLLLGDIRDIFERTGKRRIASESLVNKLKRIEGAAWVDRRGTGLTTHSLARILKRYEIEPGPFNSSKEGFFRGYSRDQFEDAFGRYLRSPSPIARKKRNKRNTN